MTLDQLRKNVLVQSRSIAAAGQDPETLAYIINCVNRFYSGDFGTVPDGDTLANLEAIAAGEGRALARYPARGELTGDIYINAYFSEDNPENTDLNNTMILYCDEY